MGWRELRAKYLPVFRSTFLPALLMFLIAPITAAHNVVSGVYADGMMIEGEIGYSNGDMAEAGSVVKVFGGDGVLITELVLGEGGVFLYEAKSATKHIFKANLSAGHVAKMIVEADEIHPPMGEISSVVTKPEKENEANTEPKSKAPMNSNLTSKGATLGNGITTDQLESIVRSAVAQQIRPLQKELKAYKEKVMLRDIAGGLGFIFGLFGVAAWMASRRKRGENNASVPRA